MNTTPNTASELPMPYKMLLRVGKICEAWGPFIGGVVGAFISYLLCTGERPVPSAPALLSAVISVGGIAVGFLSAAMAIMVSGQESEIIKRLKASGHFADFISYIHTAIWLWFILSAVSAVALIVDFQNTGLPRYWCMGWWALVVAASLSYVRVVRIFKIILIRNGM